jgi:hypothetical protein
MKKRIRYPLLAGAIVAALAAPGLGLAGGQAAAPNTVPRATTPAAHLTEAQKIQALIHSVETLKGAVFIRNGTEYDGAKAAEHLRRKLDYAGDRVQTADQFIEKLATGSSMSGKPYKIRFADGKTVDSAVFFREQLRKLEGQAPAPQSLSKG